MKIIIFNDFPFKTAIFLIYIKLKNFLLFSNTSSAKGCETVFKNQKIIYAFFVTASFLLVGTAGYKIIEGYPLLDALYMTVITISTVGFGEIQTLSGPGRVFTMFLILFGFGSIAFLAHTFTEAIIERAASQNLGRKNMLKKVRQLLNHQIICGFGRVGESAAERFNLMGSAFVVIESNEEQLKKLQELGYNYIEGDATREQTLLDAGIKRAESLLALLDEDPDNLFVVLTARELNPLLHIIARTEIASSESRMLRAGADSIISIYASAGRRVADTIMELDEEKKQKQEKPSDDEKQIWVTVTPESELENHVVETVNSILNGTIIGIRRNGLDMLAPDLQQEVQLNDDLLVSTMQKPKTILKMKERRPVDRTLVLVDDNPVIRRLYTRLFQKAGFKIFTAENGQDGFDLIISKKPDGAIIDYHLPDMNGLQVAKKIRAMEELKGLKLFMFTGDDEEKTRSDALEIGVDTVVIKSPDATEIICTVRHAFEES